MDTLKVNNVLSDYELVLRNKIKRFPAMFWKEDTRKKIDICLRYYIEDCLGLTEEEIPLKLTFQMYKESRLKSIIHKEYGEDYTQPLIRLYPKLEKWMFVFVAIYRLNRQDLAKRIRYDLKYRYRINEMQLLDIWDTNFIRTHWSSLTPYFTPFELLDLAFPNQYKPWELKHCSKQFWNKKNAIEALKWLVEIQLEISPEFAYKYLSIRTLINNGLSTPLCLIFHYNLTDYIAETYPNVVNIH